MGDRRAHTYNFNAGPSALPTEVLEEVKEHLVDFQGHGLSIMEMSHRGKVYEDVHDRAISDLRELMQISDEHEVLFLQGGASLQFAMIPMNFLAKDQQAGFLLTGSWSEKAEEEARRFGKTRIAASAKEGNYQRIPNPGEIVYDAADAYLHVTSNNTIYGTQWATLPEGNGTPLVADMSSDILSRQVDVSKFAMIYAGAQKNLGPSGVTVVIAKKDFLARADRDVPTMLRYETHVKSRSLYNTPPTFGIYVLSLVLQWAKRQGSVDALARNNAEKAALIYDVIDRSEGFYRGHAAQDSRSLMNITFRLPTPELEKAFVARSVQEGFLGLAGHRSVGGCRASTYNAVPRAASVALCDLMRDFAQKNG
ncbi:3-phosphoserine/phosphohydroxythreonine transaminase [Ferroacidibacillus organovorans]|uniref:Phosphoserine aminotransferase n=1 Tax=Ferroacidibacillus organovorans TaxID=1765683 RepID=A0A162TD17_9BACL|nr:3-phosphoserine/phosphohydroxythreonine transaminase [Ferroacidibacillus organovorans]KYP80682.1 3-phosphoserine/phosphohydroxythreonine aminotransferase [Ferroacidibacillus organovorans]OAG93281.1 3-phosphoserine/phosphohydroxythreonine aminotransferase [Ferroacidibacillus organovorans]OPG15924.1 phosphoserine transaminase [Ferroacidibacillus organovorans]